MLVASAVGWRREADGAAGRSHSDLEGESGATQTRQTVLRAREIVGATI